jgi:SWI/SNF-related matrix-associated actin-dependent regulator 1 of chromatin subfamily A
VNADQPLLHHQLGDIEWIHAVQRGLLGNEPGLGKSRSAIEAFDGGRNLVIAPSLVVESGTWEEELAKWSTSPESWTVATYSMLNERERTGRGSGTKPVKRLRENWRGTWDALVIDEAHYVKGRETSWTWASQQIAKSSGSVLLMTGTPMPNWAHELFTLLQIIYPNESKPGQRFGSFWRWAGTYFDTSPTRFSNGQPSVDGTMLECVPSCRVGPPGWVCEHYQRFARENLGDQFRRILREDALDLPELTETQINVQMTTSQGKAYRELKKHFMTEIDGEEILAWSQGAQNVLIDKVTTSDWILNPVGKPRGGKLDRLRFDLQNRSRPTLVLAHYRDVVEACAAVARDLGARVGTVHGGVSKQDQGVAVRAFKDGKLDVLCGSLETLAEGLTLTVADMAIFVEVSYKPYRNEQAKYRVHRLGQERPVTVLTYLTPNTVDQRKRKLIAQKTDQQMRVLTAAQFKELL